MMTKSSHAEPGRGQEMTNTLTTLDQMLAAYAANEAAYTRDTRSQWANSGERNKRRARLFAHQGGICLKCGTVMAEPGTDTEDSPEWSHMVPARLYGPQRAGFRWGNI